MALIDPYLIERFFGSSQHDYNIDFLHGGITNETYKITLFNGADFVIQKLNKSYTKERVDELAFIADLISKKSGFISPVYLKNRENSEKFIYFSGNYYRSYKFLHGVNIISVDSPELSYALGLFLCKFHNFLATQPIVPTYSLPHFHDTHYYVGKIKEYMNGYDVRTKPLAEKVYDSGMKIIDSNSYLTLKKNNPKQLIHGDSRFNNILFDEKTYLPVSIIDFETFIFSHRLIDAADLVRSLCCCKDQKKIRINKEIILKCIEGYLFGLPDNIRRFYKLEDFILFTKLIALELCSRFLIDIIEDIYFNWPKTGIYSSKREHHISVAETQYSIFEWFENF